MLRRPFLSAVGACSGLGIASALGLSSVDSVRATQDDEETDWEAAADERIEEHRTADLEVRVVDRNGDPIDGADVDVTMTEHDYGFGTAVNAGTLIEESEPGDEYREHIPELFNKAVMENQHKWRFFLRTTLIWPTRQPSGSSTRISNYADTPVCGRASTRPRCRKTWSRQWAASGTTAV